MNYQDSKAWPYEEARKIAQREITGRPVVFETGYGPSGLPHIGTFAEVARTTMVRRAYEDIMGYARDANTRLIVFSDDMDALRKVPDNIPNPTEMEKWIGYSLTRIPDPFGTHESFAAHNNAMLRDFLDRFGFDYEFMSATEAYRSGTFEVALSIMWDRYDAVTGIIAPTVGEARRATYSPFMPIMPDGRVIMEGVVPNRYHANTLVFPDENGESKFTFIHDGKTKCQWKADWALRWYALGVDYEMAGKDLIDSVALSSKIIRTLGATPPVTMIYEMLLDGDGHKISKSKGNGLTMDDWLRYGTPESLSAYLYREPRKAKRLHPAIVPQAMDDYYDARAKYATQTPEQQIVNPVHHVHGGGDVPDTAMPVTYQLLLNLASTAAVTEPRTLWAMIEARYPDPVPGLMEMMYRVFAYYSDTAKPERRAPTAAEAAAMLDLAARLNGLAATEGLEGPVTDEMIQFEVYEVGKAHFGKENLREWFKTLYQVLLGQDSGPRFGAFTTLYGLRQTIDLIKGACA